MSYLHRVVKTIHVPHGFSPLGGLLGIYFPTIQPQFPKDVCCFTDLAGYLSIKCHCFGYHRSLVADLVNYHEQLTIDLDAGLWTICSKYKSLVCAYFYAKHIA